METGLLEILFNIWIIASLAMFITWLIQLKTKDASYVDVVWSLGIGIATVYTFLLFSDHNIRKIIIFLCPLFWSLRLSYHLTRRLVFLNTEDSRYHTMRKSMDKKANLGFFLFFQAQAFFIVLFSMPIVMALLTESNQVTILDLIGIIIFLIAIIGETIADKQLFDHKKRYNTSVTCKSGLWYYSRHPNYFFEWIHWFSYAFFCFFTSYFYITILMPFLMLFFIIYITGIPHVEREAEKKRSDYSEYKKNTPMLIPNFFKK